MRKFFDAGLINPENKLPRARKELPETKKVQLRQAKKLEKMIPKDNLELLICNLKVRKERLKLLAQKEVRKDLGNLGLAVWDDQEKTP